MFTWFYGAPISITIPDCDKAICQEPTVKPKPTKQTILINTKSFAPCSDDSRLECLERSEKHVKFSYESTLGERALSVLMYTNEYLMEMALYQMLSLSKSMHVVSKEVLLFRWKEFVDTMLKGKDYKDPKLETYLFSKSYVISSSTSRMLFFGNFGNKKKNSNVGDHSVSSSSKADAENDDRGPISSTVRQSNNCLQSIMSKMFFKNNSGPQVNKTSLLQFAGNDRNYRYCMDFLKQDVNLTLTRRCCVMLSMAGVKRHHLDIPDTIVGGCQYGTKFISLTSNGHVFSTKLLKGSSSRCEDVQCNASFGDSGNQIFEPLYIPNNHVNSALPRSDTVVVPPSLSLLSVQISSISSGTAHCLLLSRCGGRVFGMGNNFHGQLGQGHRRACPGVVEVAQFECEDGPPIVSVGRRSSGVNSTTIMEFGGRGYERKVCVAAGGDSSFVVGSSGRVWMCGVFYFETSSRPTVLPTLLPFHRRTTTQDSVTSSSSSSSTSTTSVHIVRVFVGCSHYAALDSSGKLYTWGENTHAQLCLRHSGDMSIQHLPQEVTQVNQQQNSITTALDTHSTLHDDKYSPAALPPGLPLLPRFISVSLCENFTCALSEDGQVYMCGNAKLCSGIEDGFRGVRLRRTRKGLGFRPSIYPHYKYKREGKKTAISSSGSQEHVTWNRKNRSVKKCKFLKHNVGFLSHLVTFRNHQIVRIECTSIGTLLIDRFNHVYVIPKWKNEVPVSRSERVVLGPLVHNGNGSSAPVGSFRLNI